MLKRIFASLILDVFAPCVFGFKVPLCWRDLEIGLNFFRIFFKTEKSETIVTTSPGPLKKL